MREKIAGLVRRELEALLKESPVQTGIWVEQTPRDGPAFSNHMAHIRTSLQAQTMASPDLLKTLPVVYLAAPSWKTVAALHQLDDSDAWTAACLERIWEGRPVVLNQTWLSMPDWQAGAGIRRRTAELIRQLRHVDVTVTTASTAVQTLQRLSANPKKPLLREEDIQAAAGSAMTLPPETIVSPMARDAARQLDVRLEFEKESRDHVW
ncbi:hypothetical protein [Alkalicoccus chagannorensis]|uniref:hypothetical protein n=1 Tax=Alkalicoccus chagannorensis TaxID=427072 RepID=UPI000426AC3E|nr:hypothetical protein [Alkalicoccus chagannorensis]